MALQCAMLNDESFAAVVSHSGAILQPRKTPPARFDTPIMLMHNKQDDCFDWTERFRPMRRMLVRRGYDVHLRVKNLPIERHALTYQDVALAGIFLAPLLGYVDWKHSSE
jgi:predicted esterase